MIDPTPVLAWLRARQTYLVRTYDATLAAGDGAEAGRILARAQEIEHVRERVLGYLAGLPLDEPGEPKEGGPPRRGGVMAEQLTTAQVDAIMRKIERGYSTRKDYPPFERVPWEDRPVYLAYIERILRDMVVPDAR